jgi:hypothetical protein
MGGVEAEWVHCDQTLSLPCSSLASMCQISFEAVSLDHIDS